MSLNVVTSKYFDIAAQVLRYEEYDKRDTQDIDRYIDQISDMCRDTFYSIHENMYAI